MAPMKWPNRNKGIPSRMKWNYQDGHYGNGRKKWPDVKDGSSGIRKRGIENRAVSAVCMLVPGSRMLVPYCDWLRQKLK